MPIDVVTFELGTRSYAIGLDSVREVLRFGPVTPVPASPAVIIGAMNAGGTVLPVIDLGLTLGQGATAPQTGEPGLWVAEGDEEAVLSLGRLVEVVRLHSAQAMRPTQRLRAVTAGETADSETADSVQTQVLATERGTLHLVDLAAVFEHVGQRLVAAVRHLRE